MLVDRYKIPMKRLKEAGFEAKKGNEIMLEIKNEGGRKVNASITMIEKDFVVATVKDDKKK
jgi:hypothetical protein